MLTSSSHLETDTSSTLRVKVCTTGFSGNDLDSLFATLNRNNCKYTTKMNFETSILIAASANFSSVKYRDARERRMPVVSRAWTVEGRCDILQAKKFTIPKLFNVSVCCSSLSPGEKAILERLVVDCHGGDFHSTLLKTCNVLVVPSGGVDATNEKVNFAARRSIEVVALDMFLHRIDEDVESFKRRAAGGSLASSVPMTDESTRFGASPAMQASMGDVVVYCTPASAVTAQVRRTVALAGVKRVPIVTQQTTHIIVLAPSFEALDDGMRSPLQQKTAEVSRELTAQERWVSTSIKWLEACIAAKRQVSVEPFRVRMPFAPVLTFSGGSVSIRTALTQRAQQLGATVQDRLVMGGPYANASAGTSPLLSDTGSRGTAWPEDSESHLVRTTHIVVDSVEELSSASLDTIRGSPKVWGIVQRFKRCGREECRIVSAQWISDSFDAGRWLADAPKYYLPVASLAARFDTITSAPQVAVSPRGHQHQRSSQQSIHAQPPQEDDAEDEPAAHASQPQMSQEGKQGPSSPHQLSQRQHEPAEEADAAFPTTFTAAEVIDHGVNDAVSLLEAAVVPDAIRPRSAGAPGSSPTTRAPTVETLSGVSAIQGTLTTSEDRPPSHYGLSSSLHISSTTRVSMESRGSGGSGRGGATVLVVKPAAVLPVASQVVRYAGGTPPPVVAPTRAFLVCGKDMDPLRPLLNAMPNTAIVSCVEDCTHYIISKPVIKTETLLTVIAAGKWVLHADYITTSFVAGKKWVQEVEFEWTRERMQEAAASDLMRVQLGSFMRACRLQRLCGGGAFRGWRVVLCCLSAQRAASFQRVLKHGGCNAAVIVEVAQNTNGTSGSEGNANGKAARCWKLDVVPSTVSSSDQELVLDGHHPPTHVLCDSGVCGSSCLEALRPAAVNLWAFRGRLLRMEYIAHCLAAAPGEWDEPQFAVVVNTTCNVDSGSAGQRRPRDE